MQVNKVIILVANISLSHHSKSPEMQFSLTPKFRFSYTKPLTPPVKEGYPPLIPTPTHSCATWKMWHLILSDAAYRFSFYSKLSEEPWL